MNNIFNRKKQYINNKKGWYTCKKCNTQFEEYNKLKICTNCGYYFKMTSLERLNIICDDKSYKDIKNDKYNNNDSQDSIITGIAKIGGFDVGIGIMDSFFMAGSIGTYLIDKLCCLIDYADTNKLPLIIFSASGGIRVQEGVKALVGMAKLSQKISKYKENGLFISFLTNPTYGGLNASLSMLGDIIISENNCKIGFSGARVIQKELHQKLPEDFQTTEFNFKNGLVDIIAKRDNQKEVITKILSHYYNSNKSAQKLENENNLYIEKENINKLELIKKVRSEKHIRPYEIAESVFSDMTEIHGDRLRKEDNSIKCYLAKLDNIYTSVIYVNRRNNLKENIESSFGMINPEGYRKVKRFIKLSEKLNSPIILFVDTPGANAGYDAERNGQSIAIASLLQDISKIKVPIISYITGEANSGGAIALITGDYLAMFKHSFLSVISPEAYIDIVCKGEGKIDNIINELKILPREMLEDRIIDEIIDDSDYEKMINELKQKIHNKIIELTNLRVNELLENRIKRIEKWGNNE